MEPPPPPPPSQSPLSADLLDDLVTDILSRLPVTSLLRFRCVSKPWDSLISRNPQFVQSHLRKSPKNANLILTTYLYEDDEDEDSEYGVGAIFYSKQSLIQNNISAIVDADDHISFPLNSYIDYHDECVGSCNGLVCFRGYRFDRSDLSFVFGFRICNPSFRGMLINVPSLSEDNFMEGTVRYGFGYDSSSDTYKVVVICLDLEYTTVLVHNMFADCWRRILGFPTFPFLNQIDAQFLNGTLNWLALCSKSGFDYDLGNVIGKELEIFSLDLEEETCTHLLLPAAFDEVPVLDKNEPRLKVLGDCLCFSHYWGTQFVIWQMKEFGVRESWTQLFSISDQYIRFDGSVPATLEILCTFENGDVIVVANCCYYEAILCNWKNNTVEIVETRDTGMLREAKDYVESLVLLL